MLVAFIANNSLAKVIWCCWPYMDELVQMLKPDIEGSTESNWSFVSLTSMCVSPGSSCIS